MAAIGVAQEFQRVWAAYQRDTRTAAPQYTFAKADRRVTCYYFYLWDEDFGPAFIKVCAYFPYPAKIWVNGHEWAKRQALRAGIGFTELSNGFAACDDPAALQEICDRLQPGTIEVFAQRWLHRLPMPFGPHGPAGRVLVGDARCARSRSPAPSCFDAPRRARAFFEALIADNLDIGRPANVEIIFGRQIRRDTPGVFRTAIDRPAHRPGHRRGRAEHLLQALAGQAVPQRRPGDADRDRHQLPPRPGLQRPPAQPGRAAGQGPRGQPAHTGMLSVPARAPSLRVQPLSGSRTRPSTRTGGGPRPCGSAILGSWPWPAPSATTLLAATGITNKSLRALMTGLLHAPYTPGQMTYDLRRLRLAGLIHRIEHTNRYVLTPDGIKVAVFYTKLHNRLLRPLLAADQPQAPPELRAALRAIDQHVDDYITRARLGKAA